MSAQMGDENDDLWSEADEEELANIDSSFHDVRESKFTLQCDKILETEGPPKERYRMKYFIVSDFAKQHWCEQKLLYGLSPEIYLMRVPTGTQVNIEENEATKEIKGKGSDIHMARELEIQVPVEVTVVTKEDTWAVKLLNLRHAILAFHKGRRIAREIPVFGVPFESGLFVYGIIDELRYDPDSHSIKISELKTRKSRHPPKKSQQTKDKYQVTLYAQLFNELVQGKVRKEMFEIHLHLNLDTPLSDGVKKHVGDPDNETCTLGKLLDTVLCQAQSLTCITEASVEYIHQENKSQVALIEVNFDPEILQLEFEHQCEWWLGKRGTTGVDIEDCWKCEFCEFSPLCEWREVKAAEMSRNRLKR